MKLEICVENITEQAKVWIYDISLIFKRYMGNKKVFQVLIYQKKMT